MTTRRDLHFPWNQEFHLPVVDLKFTTTTLILLLLDECPRLTNGQIWTSWDPTKKTSGERKGKWRRSSKLKRLWRETVKIKRKLRKRLKSWDLKNLPKLTLKSPHQDNKHLKIRIKTNSKKLNLNRIQVRIGTETRLSTKLTHYRIVLKKCRRRKNKFYKS